MKKLLAIAVSLAMLSVLVPVTQAGGTQSTNYISVQPEPIITIWCHGEKTYTPHGTPDEYTTSDPVEDPINYTFEVLGWSLSGEPECAPGSALFGTEDDHAWNGAAFEVFEADFGNQLTATVNDDNFDATYHYLRGDSEAGNEEGVHTARGCGALTITIPTDQERHWQSSVDNPQYFIWTTIWGAHVDVDTLETCFASAGTATAIW